MVSKTYEWWTSLRQLGDNMQNYLTTMEASQKLGVNPRTVQQWCKIQKIPGVVKMGRIYLINENELFKWMKEQEQRPNKIWLTPKYQKV